MHRPPRTRPSAARCATRAALSLLTAAALAISFVSTAPAARPTGPRSVADVFTATTANMTPAGAHLRIQIIAWQDADARAEVVATLAGSDVAVSLAKLPTVGYLWPNGSPVGYAVKYAHHTQVPGGGERITLVTDKRVGSYDYKPWSVPNSAAPADTIYSVIELAVDGAGSGTGSLSLGAEIKLDEGAGAVALADGAPQLLVDVKRSSATH